MRSAPRRELATRKAGWARSLAHRLAGWGVRPNAVSVGSVVFAAVSGACFALVPDARGGAQIGLLLSAAATVQLRLLCNLLDGMLAVEEQLKSATGELYNEIPDRLGDIFILIGAGYSVRDFAWGVELGWIATVLAMVTAYVRVLGGSLGFDQSFMGPMAKQHRMFTLTVFTLAAAGQVLLELPVHAVRVGLGLIVVGSFLTALRRTRRIAGQLRSR